MKLCRQVIIIDPISEKRRKQTNKQCFLDVKEINDSYILGNCYRKLARDKMEYDSADKLNTYPEEQYRNYIKVDMEPKKYINDGTWKEFKL